MTTLLKHKQALYEIFTAELAGDGELFGKCDGVLKSAISKIPAGEAFIVLGEFSASDVRVGFMNKKYRIITQDILAVAPLRDQTEGEEKAEYKSFELAKAIRTILSANRNLVSVSYASGIAIETEFSNSEQVFVVIQDLLCCVQWVQFLMKVVED